MTDNPILGVTLRLLPQFMGDSTMQGGEGKGGNQYRQFFVTRTSTISHRWSSRCRQFLLPFRPPPSPSTRPPPPIPTASTISIVMPWSHPPCRNLSRPTQNPTQKPLLFYGHCVSKTWFFFTNKKLASLTRNTCKAIQCVILHHKAPKGACRRFKFCPKLFLLVLLYVVVYGGT